ncbi:MAG: hypothetical protein LUQ07_01505 [Methanospirillum sp.]|nr:hypothetical protein [Methanospirillum sp.]
MVSGQLRTLQVTGRHIPCLAHKTEEIEKCRFCAHSVRFITKNGEVASPARAFCTLSRDSGEVNLQDVTAVVCDDTCGEGYRSMLNVIS